MPNAVFGGSVRCQKSSKDRKAQDHSLDSHVDPSVSLLTPRVQRRATSIHSLSFRAKGTKARVTSPGRVPTIAFVALKEIPNPETTSATIGRFSSRLNGREHTRDGQRPSAPKLGSKLISVHCTSFRSSCGCNTLIFHFGKFETQVLSSCRPSVTSTVLPLPKAHCDAEVVLLGKVRPPCLQVSFNGHGG